MRDYYSERNHAPHSWEQRAAELTSLTPDSIVSDVSCSTGAEVAGDDVHARAVSIVAAFSSKSPIDEYTAIDVYMEKLNRVRSDPQLIQVFEDACEERKSILMLEGGLTEVEAEQGIRELDFLVGLLLHV